MISTSILFVSLLAAAGPEFTAQSLDGKSAVGRLIALDGEQAVLETSLGQAKIPVAGLGSLSRPGIEAAADPQVQLSLELIDDSTLMASEFSVSGKTATLKFPGGATATIPTRAIRSVQFSAPAARDAKLLKQWSDISESRAAGDLLVVRKNGALDYHEGVQGDVDADTCSFELDKELIPVKRAKVEGIIYFHPNSAEMPEPVARLRTKDGSQFVVRAALLADGMLKIALPSGVELTRSLEETTNLDFSTGKIVYLSDLTPESATLQPFVSFKEDLAALRDFYEYRRDVGFEQSPLRLAGKPYTKGLALQSRTTLVYKLPGKFRLLRTIMGIDDNVRETGSVHVDIKGDGKSLWQADVRGGEAPRELELEIVGVKRLEILVDYGDNLDFGDRLNLCDVRVTK